MQAVSCSLSRVSQPTNLLTTLLMTRISAPPRRLRVTRHFRDGDRAVDAVDRHQVGALDSSPRPRRLSVAWEDNPRVVLVAATPHSARAVAALPELCATLKQAGGLVVVVEPELAHAAGPGVMVLAQSPGKMSQLEAFAAPLVPLASEESSGAPTADEVDLVMTLGGDGLILHVISHLFPRAVPPVMPFNMGSMGFLTPFDFANHTKDINAILSGQNNSVTMRMRLKCKVIRKPTVASTPPLCIHNFQDDQLHDGEVTTAASAEYHVLNELVIDRGPAPYLSNLEVLCDDCPVTNVQADGIIVATPTGSTAYSLSSGGSMVHPAVPAILFTPICPHSLSFRPVLFPDYVTLQIKVPDDARASAWVSFDGRHRMELMRGDKVIVCVSPWSVPTFTKKDATNDWFASVSQCLRWNERVVQGSNDQ